MQAPKRNGVSHLLRERRMPACGGTPRGRGGTRQAGRDPRASAVAPRAAACSGTALRTWQPGSLRPPSDRAFPLGSETCERLEKLAGSRRGCASRWLWGEQGQGLGEGATGYEIARMGPMGWGATGNRAMGTAVLGVGTGVPRGCGATRDGSLGRGGDQGHGRKGRGLGGLGVRG